jgi:hypothetical protein
MLKFSKEQHREYIHFARKVGAQWVEVFDGNNEFYSTPYWDLLSEMWYADKPLMVSDALRYMKSIKSPFTARKYLQKLINEKMVLETKNPNDERSMLVSISPQLKTKLDGYFDFTMAEMVATAGAIKK